MEAENKAHITEIEVEHKACITELETRASGMPPVMCNARVAEMKGCATTIDTRLVETQKLLDEATHTWTTMDEVHGLI